MILVFGSFMMDCVTSCKVAPQAGQTISGYSYERFLGGKGINQAVAARRLSSQVEMIGILGKDSFAREFIDLMDKEAIEHPFVEQCEHQTGIGSIIIEENGQNRIIIIPGANLFYKDSKMEELIPRILEAEICMTQLENNFLATEKFLFLCKKFKKKIILNPAPAIFLSPEILNGITYLTPNETELEILVKRPLPTLEERMKACKELIDLGVENVITTLGKEGALIYNQSVCKVIPGYKVTAVDTVAAGDSFNGALAYCLENNYSLEESVRFANAVGALTVQKKGAIPSLPTLKEVQLFLGEKDAAK